ncbi:phenylalanine--tRNA ligase beta subunit-related protein [Clostridium sp. Marseille-Q2269]|uniref:B3/B4 domain-containing protein n=1 Tax=Clostridium sp. Marseille-Q2269 TaxID=2942205 RepID=UPI002073BFE0|nr:phenylalanine--tRNA ligase beta subunit-related protein [Clostridium sp. Marseille-Q2269]
MKFVVSKEVFQKLENVCFGVVVAKGINNKDNIEAKELLKNSIELTEKRFEGKNVKEVEEIMYYRDSFIKLGINPNKFKSSIEAITTRVSKNKGLPNINPIVDIGNAVSLKYLLPLGAHDIDAAKEDISVRFSNVGDKFIPFGEDEVESLENGELIYSVGNKVKTRRWIWRQSEEGKITEESKNIFFPIDGFKDKNYDNVIKARDELAQVLKQTFHCEIKVGFVDIDNREFEL